jgi:cell division inhibitor SepF
MDVARSLRDVVSRFAAADEYDEYDEYEEETYAAAAKRPDVRRLRGSHGSDFDDIYDGESAAPGRSSRDFSPRPLALVRPQRIEFGLVAPRTFEGAQQIADRFRADAPVIVDLQGCEAELAKRLVDFCSGLTYALEGSLQIVDDTLLMLAPNHVELSGEATVGLRERGFFNQV